MTEPNDSEVRLERLIHSALRELPLRQAPRTLEQRVLREIARREAVAHSRFDFMSWPLVARIAFILVCIGTAKLSLVATSWGVSKAAGVLSFIPSSWLTGALLFAGVMYAALFALGAVAFRTLSIER